MAPDDNPLRLGCADGRLGKSRVEPQRPGRSGSQQRSGQDKASKVSGCQSLHPRDPPMLFAYGFTAQSLTKNVYLCHFVTKVSVIFPAAAKWRKRWRLRSLAVLRRTGAVQ